MSEIEYTTGLDVFDRMGRGEHIEAKNRESLPWTRDRHEVGRWPAGSFVAVRKYVKADPPEGAESIAFLSGTRSEYDHYVTTTSQLWKMTDGRMTPKGVKHIEVQTARRWGDDLTSDGWVNAADTLNWWASKMSAGTPLIIRIRRP